MAHLKPITAGLAAAVVSLALGLPAAAEEPRQGGALIFAMDAEPRTLDPIHGDASTTDRHVYNLIYDGLILMTSTGDFAPQLATSWSVAADNMSIELTLRDDVRFHDGTPFNAEAVKFNLDRVRDPKENAVHAADVEQIASVEVVGEHKVRVNLSAPSGAILAGLAAEAGAMASPTAVREAGQDYARNPVGTGPFRFVEWLGGERIKVEKNPDYWQKDAAGRQLPYLDSVTARFITDPTVKLVELKTGNLQAIDSVPVREFENIAQAPDLTLVDPGTGQHMMAAFNVTRPPFDNENLRKAVILGIDREALRKVVAGSEGAVTPSPLPPRDWAFSPDIAPQKFDPAAAKAAYEASGHTGEISFSIIQREPDSRIAQVIQAQLNAIGIPLKVEVLERQAWLDKVRGMDYQMAMLRVSVPRRDPDQIIGRYFGKDAPVNWAGLDVPAALADPIAKAATSLDFDERKRLYAEAQRALLDTHAYAFLFLFPVRYAARQSVQGLDTEYSGSYLMTKAWIAD